MLFACEPLAATAGLAFRLARGLVSLAGTGQRLRLKRSTRSRRAHVVIKPDNLLADDPGRELADDQFPRGVAISCAQFGRGCEFHDRLSQRLRIFDPHQKAGLIVDHDLAAARRVGGDHGASARGGFHQASGQALAVRRQDREMTSLPQRRDILDVSEPGDARALRPFVDFLQRDRSGIGRVRIAGNEQVGFKALLSPGPHDVVRGHQRADAFIRQQTSRKAVGDGPVGFGQRQKSIGVDARSRNQNDSCLADPEIDQCGAIVGILDQHHVAGPVQERGQQPFQDRSEQTGPPRRRGKDVTHSGQRADIRKCPAECGDRSIDATLQAGVVGDIRLDAAGDLPKRKDRRNRR